MNPYLTPDQLTLLNSLLGSFFALPYSTDLDGKDAETLLKIAKGLTNAEKSKRKELFDIVLNDTGYSVKTLRKPTRSVRVDLQEQRFCDVKGMQELERQGQRSPATEGALLLQYMNQRMAGELKRRNLKSGRSLILLKNWNAARTRFDFIYWEEDFAHFVSNLADRNAKGEIEWISQGAGIHGRDRLRQGSDGQNVRLIRMHHKHNQIFTDHDIPNDAVRFSVDVNKMDWLELAQIIASARAKDAKEKALLFEQEAKVAQKALH